MLSRAMWLAAVAALLVTPPALASARGGAKKNHPVNLTITLVVISLSGNAGSPGFRETDAQLDSGTPGGAGAGVTIVTYGAGPTYTANTTVFSESGSIRVSLTGTYALGAIRFTLMGSGRITGGTGLYRGASGRVTFTGGAVVGEMLRTLHVTGEIKY